LETIPIAQEAEQRIDEIDSLFFFKDRQKKQKLFKKINLESIREI